MIDSCVSASSTSVGSVVEGEMAASCAHYSDCGHEKAACKSCGAGVDTECTKEVLIYDRYMVRC